jgi:hypothetical protein
LGEARFLERVLYLAGVDGEECDGGVLYVLDVFVSRYGDRAGMNILGEGVG